MPLSRSTGGKSRVPAVKVPAFALVSRLRGRGGKLWLVFQAGHAGSIPVPLVRGLPCSRRALTPRSLAVSFGVQPPSPAGAPPDPQTGGPASRLSRGSLLGPLTLLHRLLGWDVDGFGLLVVGVACRELGRPGRGGYGVVAGVGGPSHRRSCGYGFAGAARRRAVAGGWLDVGGSSVVVLSGLMPSKAPAGRRSGRLPRLCARTRSRGLVSRSVGS